MIRFQNVAFSYREDEPVLTGVEIEFEAGLTLVLGPNGCGKSTLLKLAAGVEKPDSGNVTVDGFDLWKSEIESRRGLAYVSEQPDLTPYATLKEIMSLVCRLRGEPPALGKDVLEFFDLGGLAARTVRELSLGQRRRAVFATALIGRPGHILLDEPLEGLDGRIQGEILAWLDRRLEAGATVLIVSHALEPFADRLSRAVAFKAGSTVKIEDKLPHGPEARLRFCRELAKGAAV